MSTRDANSAASSESPKDAAAAPAQGANREVADRLWEMAGLLEQQQSNLFRVSAYRRAAQAVARLDGDLRDIVARSGAHGLMALPNIGRGIAGAIVEEEGQYTVVTETQVALAGRRVVRGREAEFRAYYDA